MLASDPAQALKDFAILFGANGDLESSDHVGLRELYGLDARAWPRNRQGLHRVRGHDPESAQAAGLRPVVAADIPLREAPGRLVEQAPMPASA